MCESECPPVPQHIWPQLQSISLLSMSSISGPCQTNGSWSSLLGSCHGGCQPRHSLQKPLFLASSEAALSINRSPLSPRLQSLKTVAPGSPWAPASNAKPVAADKPGATSYCLFALLSSACLCATLCLRWCPKASLCGPWAVWSVGSILPVLVLTPVFFLLCCFLVTIAQAATA